MTELTERMSKVHWQASRELLTREDIVWAAEVETIALPEVEGQAEEGQVQSLEAVVGESPMKEMAEPRGSSSSKKMAKMDISQQTWRSMCSKDQE